MKIIFLDIDGVLNSLRSATAWENVDVALGTKDYNAEVTRTTIDPVAVQLINKLVEESGAKIVVSSSHRLMFIKKYGYAEMPVLDLVGLRQYIHHQGIVAEVIDATEDYYFPRRKQGAIRGDEIKLWLDSHPEVENYVIFDDDPDMLEEQVQHFVHTSTIDGFRFEHYCKARAILKLEPVSASVNTLCRTDQEYFTALSYEQNQVVRYVYNGIRSIGVIKGLSFFAEHIQIYIIEDTTGAFPNDDYPFNTVSVPYSSISLMKEN